MIFVKRGRVQKNFAFFSHTQTQRASEGRERTASKSKLLSKIDQPFCDKKYQSYDKETKKKRSRDEK